MDVHMPHPVTALQSVGLMQFAFVWTPPFLFSLNRNKTRAFQLFVNIQSKSRAEFGQCSTTNEYALGFSITKKKEVMQ